MQWGHRATHLSKGEVAEWEDYLWVGRYKEAGKGEGGSNLKFDQIEPIPSAP